MSEIAERKHAAERNGGQRPPARNAQSGSGLDMLVADVYKFLHATSGVRSHQSYVMLFNFPKKWSKFADGTYKCEDL